MKALLPWISLVALLFAASCSKEEGDGATGNLSTESSAVAAETERSPVAEHRAQTAATPDTALAAKLSELEALVELVLADAADLPRAEFEPAALAKMLGTDPQAHFDWVRDHTWWAPYRGLLRGAKGVLLDRVGSNADRAMLLGDLLRHSGHTVRVVHAELPADVAQDLLTKVRPLAELRRGPVTWKADTPERDRETETIFPGFEESQQKSIAESKRLTAEAGALVRSQGDRLFATVKDSAGESRTAEDQAAVVAMQDHWWVERQAGDQWIAMDVLLPEAEPGDTLVTGAGRSEWKSTDDLPALPEDDWHAVRIRVVVERYEAGETTESTALETTLRPAQVFDRPVTLRHLPMPWPDELPSPEVDPNALGNAAVNVKEWVPFLQVGDEFVAQSGFTENGNLVGAPLDSKRDVAETGGAGFMTGFGEALGGGDTASSAVTAEWIDYEIRVPGKQPQNLRRPVFDLLGPARRAEKIEGFDASTNELLVLRYEALLSSIDILLQPSEFTREFVIHLKTAAVVANRAALKELTQLRDPATAKLLAMDLLSRLDVWGPLPDLVLWRSTLGNSAADGFVDRPNVLNYHVTQPVVAGRGFALREVIDIASNPTGVRQGSIRSPFEVRLRQGVADTVAELLVFSSDLGGRENTASIFATEGVGPDDSLLIAPGDAASVQGLGWPADTTARLAQTVEGGFMAVALKNPVKIGDRERLGWWRIDPATGETIGVMDTGLHQDLTERAELEETLVRIRTWLSSRARREARRGMTPAQRAHDDAIALRLARVYRQIEELIPLMP